MVYELRASEFFSEPSLRQGGPPGVGARSVDLLPGLTVSLVSSRGSQTVQATAHNDRGGGRDCVHVSCLLQGTVQVAFGGSAFHLETGSLMTSYAPGERFRLTLPGDLRNIEVMVTLDTLEALAGDGYERIGPDIRRGFCVRRGGRNRRAGEAAARLAHLIAGECPQRLLIHAAALEFLAWNLGPGEPDGEGDAVSPRDRRLLMAARDRLLQDLGNPPTIADLARETGLNQLKLKRGFKTLFGHSVYALFQRERMERARVLLDDHRVTETAVMLGYSNISHFSAAFRKQFGILPRDVRRGVGG